MISVEHMQELIDRFNGGELDIRDIIEQSYFGGGADAIDEFADLMLEKLPRNMDKTFTCGEIALLICGVAEQLNGGGQKNEEN